MENLDMEMLFTFACGILIGSIIGIFISGLLFSAEDKDNEDQEKWIKEYFLFFHFELDTTLLMKVIQE